MTCSRKLSGAATAVAIGAAAAVFPSWMAWMPSRRGLPSSDIYGYLVPSWIYARESLALGHGLLWNSFQNCGQPFFADIQVGLLYPFHVLFFLFDPVAALLGVATLNLLVAGMGAYLLSRQIELNRAGSLCAALAFQLTIVTYGLTIWMPAATLGSYVWLPVALLCCERILRWPTVANGVLLAAVLAVQCLPGVPQTCMFTYQLIVLRLLWELVSGDCPSRPRMIGAVALGLGLGVGLSAVQMVPASEFAVLSVRSGSLSLRDIIVAPLEWRELVAQILQRKGVHPFALVPCLLVAVGMIAGRRRRVPLFYLVAALTYAALVVNPLLGLYLNLPFIGRLFRDPRKFLWVSSFALSIPVGYGVHVITQRCRLEPVRKSWRVAGAALVVTVAWLLAASPRPTPAEWVMLLGVAVVSLPARGRLRFFAAGVLPFVLAWNLLSVLPPPAGLKETATYYRQAPLLRVVAARAGPQQRLNLMGIETGLMVKTASVLRIPTTRDYQPQTSRRYAELLVRMNRNRDYPLDSNNIFIFFEGKPPANRPLANLTALRFIVLDGGARLLQRLRGLSYVLRDQRDDITIWENPTALPRAFYVSRLEVVESPRDLLERLASREHDPRRTALVERPPADGFLGSAAATPAGEGEVVRFEDRSETLTVGVRAEQSGFLFVADQYYPGWEAMVNGAPAEVLRANYVFRAVRVPAGESTVVFRYRPRSLRVGALISAAALLVAVALLARRRRRGAGAPRERKSKTTIPECAI